MARLFRRMGFEASRDGASGRKDVLVVAPIGSDEYSFTVEAKGSKQHPVKNDDAEISGANAHRHQVGAKLAVVVAREFAGFGQERDDRPAILQECDATEGKVTIATVEVLKELLEATRAYGYALNDILPVLEVVETPNDKLKRVQDLRNPMESFDYRGVLEEIWKEQQGRARGDIVPYRSLWQSRPDRWGLSEPDQFLRRLRALEALSGNLLQILDGEQAVVMRQNPEIVAECIQRGVTEARQ